jgi:integrase
MPKKAKELTAKAISNLKADGRYAVGGVDGLHLRIAGASRAWVLRVVVGTRINAEGSPVIHRRDIGLGSFDDVTLAEARDKARELRKQVREGIDPLEAKEAEQRAKLAAKAEDERRKTFKECAESVIEKKGKELRNTKALAQWRSTLEKYAYPVLNDGRKIDELKKQDVLRVLKPIWSEKTETASRLRGRIETVFDYAKANDAYHGDNPAAWKGMLEPLLPKPNKVKQVKHHAALPYAEIGAFMAELRKREGMSARALEFSILTAARSGEARGALWGEIDMDAKVWILPRERMKADKEHRVALCDAAIALLRSLPRIEGDDTVFAAPRGGALSDQAFQKLFERMGCENITQHGFRSTFRDWAGETTAHPREVIEHALAHSLKDKAEAAYARGDLMAKRQRLMADWGRYCGIVREPGSEAGGTVVTLREAV